MQVPNLSQNQRFPHTFIFESLLHFYVQCMELKGCNILNIVIYTVLSSTLPLCSCPKWWWAVPFSCLMLYNVCYVCPTSKLAAGKCQYIKRTCSLDEVNFNGGFLSFPNSFLHLNEREHKNGWRWSRTGTSIFEEKRWREFPTSTCTYKFRVQGSQLNTCHECQR